MAKKQPKNSPAPTVHVCGVAPPHPNPPKDPCRHRRNKKKKQVFVVYKAEEDTGSGPTGNFYIGRTRGPTADDAKNTRERGHHRRDIGSLEVVCVHDSYAACRGAEQKHYDDMVKKKKQITTPRQKGSGEQIAPISKDNDKKGDYEACAKLSANNATPPPSCKICAA